MSLHVFLIEDVEDCLIAADLCEERGFDAAAKVLRRASVEPREFYSANVSHNLNRMAEAAGLYPACWCPVERGWTRARQLIPRLEAGLARLRADPHKYQAYNPGNGWGSYDGFVPWVGEYLDACREHPDAVIKVSR